MLDIAMAEFVKTHGEAWRSGPTSKEGFPLPSLSGYMDLFRQKLTAPIVDAITVELALLPDGQNTVKKLLEQLNKLESSAATAAPETKRGLFNLMLDWGEKHWFILFVAIVGVVLAEGCMEAIDAVNHMLTERQTMNARSKPV